MIDLGLWIKLGLKAWNNLVLDIRLVAYVVVIIMSILCKQLFVPCSNWPFSDILWCWLSNLN